MPPSERLIRPHARAKRLANSVYLPLVRTVWSGSVTNVHLLILFLCPDRQCWGRQTTQFHKLLVYERSREVAAGRDGPHAVTPHLPDNTTDEPTLYPFDSSTASI